MIVLHHTPGACSRVTMVALLQAGLSFEDRPVDIFKGQQRSPAYLAISPKGKVPTLEIDGQILTETPAIIWALAGRYPEAGLLPTTQGAPDIQGLIDLSWVSNTLHILARAARVPMRMTTGDPEPVRASALAQLDPILAGLAQRLDGDRWWYGERWSVLDVYLDWVVGMAAGGGAVIDDKPSLVAHAARLRQWPSFQMAVAREQAALDQSGIVLPGGGKL